MEQQLAVGAVVLRKDGAVLLVRRARPPAAGTWSLPGGKVEQGETPELAVVREVKEETALDVRVVGLVLEIVLEREGYAYRILDFACAPECATDVRAGDDAADVQWVDPTDMSAFGVTAEVARAIAAAQKMA